MDLRVCTYNIHKGFSQFNRQLVIHDLREGLRGLRADIVFLQEVQGLHVQHARHRADWPRAAQHEFLAQGGWESAIYGGNAFYEHGHHGNAILSRLRVAAWDNQDVSAHPLEQRGLLHTQMVLPGETQRLHCICVHLGLIARWRHQQVDALVRRVRALVPAHAPLIIAGDFNDWRNRLSQELASQLEVQEVFSTPGMPPARSYPAALPLLRLDRIYVRGFKVQATAVHSGRPWSRISDHAALTADLKMAARWH